MLVRHEYVLLAPPVTAVNPTDVGDQDSGEGHESIGERANQPRRETGEGEETQQHALLARGMQGVDNKEGRPPERTRALSTCGLQGGGKRGGPPNQQCAPMVRSQVPGG